MVSKYIAKKSICNFLVGQNVNPLTRDQIQLVIDEEISKPENEMNTDLIDTCSNLIIKLDGIDVHDIPKFEKALTLFDQKELKTKKPIFFIRKPIKVLCSACIAFAILITVNTISTLAFNYNFANGVVDWTSNKITIFFDRNNTPKSGVAYSDIKVNLEAAGFKNIVLPTLCIDDLSIEHIYYETSENSKTAYVKLVNEFGSMSIMISQCISPEQFKNDLDQRYNSGEEISSNGITFYYFNNNDLNSFVFVNGNARYIYSTTFDEDATKKIMKSIK